MKLSLDEQELKFHFYLWIFLAVTGWILWFMILDRFIQTGGFKFMVIFEGS
ncbi:MAG: hypothetical protein WBA22_00765 [Candidatus Methanofastidiosia archaeon]